MLPPTVLDVRWPVKIQGSQLNMNFKETMNTFLESVCSQMGLPQRLSGKESICQCRSHRRCGVDPWDRKTPWRSAWQSTPVFLPGESHGQRILVVYSPQGHKESGMTEAAEHAHTHAPKCCHGHPVFCLLNLATPVGWKPGTPSKEKSLVPDASSTGEESSSKTWAKEKGVFLIPPPSRQHIAVLSRSLELDCVRSKISSATCQ